VVDAQATEASTIVFVCAKAKPVEHAGPGYGTVVKLVQGEVDELAAVDRDQFAGSSVAFSQARSASDFMRGESVRSM